MNCRIQTCKNVLICHVLAVAFFFASSDVCQAQWRTQALELVPGFNAVYLHVDGTHVPVSELVGDAPINEIWMWNPPASATQFVTSVESPTSNGSNWLQWKPGEVEDLKVLVGSAAYLVNSTADYNWNVKGRPRLQDYRWNTDGQNFVGFPIPADRSDLIFDNFLGKNQELQFAVNEIYHYIGGGLESSLNASSPFNLNVKRGEAYWIDANGLYNQYFGPFQLILEDKNGVILGDKLSRYRVRIRNVIKEPITITMEMLNSEEPPALTDFSVDLDSFLQEVQPIQATPPMLLRGARQTDGSGATLLTYSYSDLNSAGPVEFTLPAAGQAGSEIEIVLGLNRSAMSGGSGDFFAGILQFSDSLGFTQLEVPVAAHKSSKAGLWVGDVEMSRVRNNITFYERDDDGTVFNEDGSVNPTGNVEGYNGTPRSYKQRMILHVDGNDDVRLMQSVFYGVDVNDGESRILANSQDLLDPDQLSAARRVSSVHLPWTDENAGWVFTGSLSPVSADLDGTTTLELLEIADRSEIPSGLTSATVVASLGGSLLLQVYDDAGQLLVESDELLLATYGTDFENFETLVVDGLAAQAESTLTAEARLEILAAAETLITQAQLVTEVSMAYGAQETSPFLHTYHPDHDNRDAEFSSVALEQGQESYDFKRTVALLFSAQGDDFDSLTSGATQMAGNYAEEITLTGKPVYGEGGALDHYETRHYGVQGTFNLIRISDIATIQGIPAP